MIMASPQNTLKLTQTNPYTTQNQNLDGVFRGALRIDLTPQHSNASTPVNAKVLKIAPEFPHG
jgi:hypothetical protein